MRLTKISALALLTACLSDSCVNPPEYSVIPHIDLESITFMRGDINKGVPDTLAFKLKFKDGDGDLGAYPSNPNSLDQSNPWYYFYNVADFSTMPQTNYTDQVPGYKLINYQVKRTIPQFADLPGLVCGSWELLRQDGRIIDTLYITQNLKAFNVHVDVFSKQGGAYLPYGPNNYDIGNCPYNLFRATFPNLSKDRSTALAGLITFRIISLDLYRYFNTQTLKMDVTIFDRAYHASNVVGKKDFTIAQISK